MPAGLPDQLLLTPGPYARASAGGESPIEDRDAADGSLEDHFDEPIDDEEKELIAW